jgi:hypothetical protein
VIRKVTALVAAAVIAGAASGTAGVQSRETPVVHRDIPVTAVDLRKSEAANSPMVVVDPENPAFAVTAYRVDAPDYSCGLAVSGDGGRSWVPARPVPLLPPGAEKCFAPEVGFDKTGRLYYLFVGLSGPGNTPMGVFLTASDDYGKSFSEPRRVLGPHVFGVRMAIDADAGERGRMHMVWIQASGPPPLGAFPEPPNPIVAAYSDDGGKTFSARVQVSGQERPRAVAPTLVLGPGNAVHVLYYDLRDDARDYQGLEGPVWDGPWSLVLSSSADGGRSFGRGVVVEDEVVPPERVILILTMAPATIAADGRGTLYVGWHDARNGDWDVFVRRSTDGGRTWGDAGRINDDPLRNGRHQYLPRLSVAPNGRVDAVFYDRREDPANLMNDVFYAWSADGGAFAANLRLTTESFDPRIGRRYPSLPSAVGLVEFGSRVGLESLDGRAIAAWTDTRNVAISAEDVPGGTPRADEQNVYGAEVLFGPRPSFATDDGSPTAATLALLAGLGAVAALAGGLGWRARRRKHRPFALEPTTEG